MIDSALCRNNITERNDSAYFKTKAIASNIKKNNSKKKLTAWGYAVFKNLALPSCDDHLAKY